MSEYVHINDIVPQIGDFGFIPWGEEERRVVVIHHYFKKDAKFFMHLEGDNGVACREVGYITKWKRIGNILEEHPHNLYEQMRWIHGDGASVVVD